MIDGFFTWCGENRKLLSFIIARLAVSNFNVVYPDLSLYNTLKYKGEATCNTWARCNYAGVSHCQIRDVANIVIWIESWCGGMLAYQVLGERKDI